MYETVSVRTGNDAEQPPKYRVHHEMDMLQQEVTNVMETFELLAGRVECVMQDPGPAEATREADVKRDNSRIADRIAIQRERLACITALVTDMVSRLEV